MAVECTNCGEQLMGSVNRCWRCGHEFISRPGPAEVPPVRRSPIPAHLEEALAAEVLESGTAVLESSADAAASGRWSRRGSPFADTASPQNHADTLAHSQANLAPQLPNYPSNSGAGGGAGVSVVLGLIGFGLAFIFPLGALIVAALGMAMGIWGVYSKRRGAAIFGLLICCAALAIAGFYGAVALYTYIHGVSPFETVVPVSVQP